MDHVGITAAGSIDWLFRGETARRTTLQASLQEFISSVFTEILVPGICYYCCCQHNENDTSVLGPNT